MRWLDFSVYGMSFNLADIVGPDGDLRTRATVFGGVLPEYHDGLLYCGYSQGKKNPQVWYRLGDTVDIDRLKQVFAECELIDTVQDEITLKFAVPSQPRPAAPAAEAKTFVAEPSDAETPAEPDVAGTSAADTGMQSTRRESYIGWFHYDFWPSSVIGVSGPREIDVFCSRDNLVSRKIDAIPRDVSEIWSFGNTYSLYQDEAGRRYVRYNGSGDRPLRRQEHDVIDNSSFVEQIMFMRPLIRETLDILIDAHIAARIASGSTAPDFEDFLGAVDIRGDWISRDEIIDLFEEKAGNALDDRGDEIEDKRGRRRVNTKKQDFKVTYDRATRLVAPGRTAAPALLAATRLVRSISRGERNLILAVGNPVMSRFLDTEARLIPSFRGGQEERMIDSAQVMMLDFTSADSRAALAEPIDHDGYPATTEGEHALLDALERQSSQSRTIVLINQPEGEKAEDLWAHIARRFAIEGRAILSASMAGVPGQATVMASIGNLRPEVLPDPPEASMRRRFVTDWNDLWSWTSEVVISRGKIKKFYEMLGDVESAVANAYQAEYTPMSSSGKPFTMVPRNIEHATRSAFASFRKMHGDVDHFVAQAMTDSGKEMTIEDLRGILGPEQIDAIGIASTVKSRKIKGFLLADQTGIGKGRFCAVMTFLGQSGVLGTNKTLLLTERADNISDLVRDLRDTGVFEKMNVAVLNDDAKVVNRDTREVTYHGLPKDVWQECFEKGVWPEGVDVIIATYSNFNRSDVVQVKRRGWRRRAPEFKKVENSFTRKTSWIKKVVNEDVAIIRDESQNGSPTSQSGLTIRQLVDQCGIAIDSSGSYLREAAAITQYPELFPASVAGQDMASILRRGGDTAMEALAYAMVESGVMLRREHKIGLSNIIPVNPTEDEVSDNIKAKDALAVVLSEMAYMSGMVNERVNVANQAIIDHYISADPELRRQLADAEQGGRGPNREVILGRLPTIKMRSIGGTLYMVARAFTAAMTAQVKVPETAIEQLRNGVKPVILFESTNETVLKDLLDALTEEGEEDQERVVSPQFRDILRKIVKRSLHGRVTNADRNNRRLRNVPGVLLQKTARQKKAEREERILMTMQDPDDMKNYMGAKALRFVLASPDIQDVVARDDKPAMRQLIEDGIEQGMKEAVGNGYATAEFLSPLAVDLKNAVHGELETVNCAAILQENHGIQAMPKGLGGYLIRIDELILGVPDLSSSAIDTVMDQVRKAGFSIGEITGRKLRVEDGRIIKRTDTDRIATRDAFNGYGEEADRLDAVVINMAGAVGTDMHATEKTPDKRPRCMIVAEIPQDVITLLQAYGRITRFGSLHSSSIFIPNLGLVCHEHLIAMINAKVRRWSAGIAGNRDNANAIDGVHEMLNLVGDIVATQYLKANPEMIERLGLHQKGNPHQNQDQPPAGAGNGREVEEAERAALEAGERANTRIKAAAGRRPASAINAAIIEFARTAETSRTLGLKLEESEEDDVKYRMSQVIQRLIMLPSDEERRILDTLTQEYEALIEELNARGENPLRAQQIDAKVHVQSVVPMSGMFDDGGHSKTAFERQVMIQNVLIEQTASPIRSAAVERMVAQSQALGSGFLATLDSIESTEARPYKVNLNATIDEEIANGNQRLRGLRDRVNNVRWAIRNLAPGRLIDMALDSERVQAISLGVFENQWRSPSPAGYVVKVLIPGHAEVRKINLKTIMIDPEMASSEGLDGNDRDKVLNEFDTASDASRVRKRIILTGNTWTALYMAQAMKVGHMVSWAGQGGVIHRGVLVNSKTSEYAIPTEIATREMFDHVVRYTSGITKAYSDISYFRPLGPEEKRVEKSHFRFNRIAKSGMMRFNIRASTKGHEVNVLKNPDIILQILRSSIFLTTPGLKTLLKNVDRDALLQRIERDDLVELLASVITKSKDAIADEVNELGANITDSFRDWSRRAQAQFSSDLGVLTGERGLERLMAASEEKDSDAVISMQTDIESFRPIFDQLIDLGLRFYAGSSVRAEIQRHIAEMSGDKAKIAELEAHSRDTLMLDNTDEDDVDDGARDRHIRVIRNAPRAPAGAPRQVQAAPAQQEAPVLHDRARRQPAIQEQRQVNRAPVRGINDDGFIGADDDRPAPAVHEAPASDDFIGADDGPAPGQEAA